MESNTNYTMCDIFHQERAVKADFPPCNPKDIHDFHPHRSEWVLLHQSFQGLLRILKEPPACRRRGTADFWALCSHTALSTWCQGPGLRFMAGPHALLHMSWHHCFVLHQSSINVTVWYHCPCICSHLRNYSQSLFKSLRKLTLYWYPQALEYSSERWMPRSEKANSAGNSGSIKYHTANCAGSYICA